MEAASPVRDMVRTKNEASGSSRTAKARKGMVEATEAVSGYIDSLRAAPDPVLKEMEEHGRRDGIPIVPPDVPRGRAR